LTDNDLCIAIWDAANPIEKDADKLKDQQRRAYAGLFGDGSEERLHHEWAEYCRECANLITNNLADILTLDKNLALNQVKTLEVPRCSKLGVEIPHDALDRKEKRLDCPLGADEGEFFERRKREIAEEHREFAFRMFENKLNEVWPEFKDRIIALIQKKSAETE